MQPDNALVLVLGGVRSGKSVFAENLALGFGRPVYIATAEVGDDDMRERVAQHRQRRGSDWDTVEEPLELAAAVRDYSATGRPLLIDSLGMWVSNLLHAGRELDVQTATLLESLAGAAGPVIVVSDEVGLGGVASNPLARQFADSVGMLNQRVAAAATDVHLVVAGIATTLKSQQKS